MLETTTLATSALLAAAGWLPTGLVWNQAELPVPYCLSANSTNTNVSAAGQRAALLQGINAWVSTSAGGSMSCTLYTAAAAGGACGRSVNSSDGRFDIFFTTAWRNGSGTIGVTWSVGDGRGCGSVTDDTGRRHQLGCKYDSDIELNDADFFWTDSGRNGTDIASITAHEYGHFIGLDHCNDNRTCNIGGAIMFASYPGGTIRVPFADDVQGACALYPGVQGGLGWPCTAAGGCTSRICVNPGASGYCSETCGRCPTGYRCGPNPQNPGQSVCLRDDGLDRATCEECQVGLPGACANDGLCIRGLPEQGSGRCVPQCGAGDSCPSAQYQCLPVQFQDGTSESYCFPRSSDCTNLGNFTEADLGQRCSGAQPCRAGLTCVGICAPSCDPGSCPAGWGCEAFQGGESYCLPEVGEGQSCEGLVSCSAGPCLLSPDTNLATCYRDCAGNPRACNNAQACNTYELRSGVNISVCEPPGVPPLPPDAGVVFPDASAPDAATPPDRDAGVEPADAGVEPADAGPPAFCECDRTYACDSDPASGASCACDPECLCECDRSFACDPGCGACDPECARPAVDCSSCSVAGPARAGGLLWGAGLLLLGALRVRRRR